MPLTLTSLLLTLALSANASPMPRGDVAAAEIAQSLDALRIELSLGDDSEVARFEYAYDRDDRLTGTTVTASDNTVTETTYELDVVGNRTREHTRRDSITVSDIAYHYHAHQRLSDTHDSVCGLVTEYSYDDRGHLISETRQGQTTTYRPNAQDRLATLTLPGAPPVDYRYDPEGKRIERRTPSEVTRFGWDGAQLRRETNVANNLQDSHDWAAGRILQSRHLSTPRYAQHDAQRSPIRWSHASGIEQGQARYDAWGNTTTSNPDLPRIAYTGHYLEREGDRYYAQQRYYQPRLGRFNRIDPWQGNPLSPITLNKYLYGNGNPLAYIDPDGRESVTTMIDNAAEGCGPVSCAGWATLQAVWQVGSLGFAAVHDPARDAYDRGEISTGEYYTAIGGGMVVQGTTIVTAGWGSGLVAGATGIGTRVAVGASLGGASGAVIGSEMQATHMVAGLQSEYDPARTAKAGALGFALGGALTGAAEGAMAADAAVAARRSALSSTAATNRVVQQSQPVVTAEAGNGAVVGVADGAGGMSDLARIRSDLRALDTSAYTTAQKGALGESRASLTFQRAGYNELYARLPSNNGFDGVFVRYEVDGVTPVDIVINESKFTLTGRVSLSNTNMGRQMSAEWIDANI